MDTLESSGFQNALISGYALNVNWILTHILHAHFPAQFGPLLDEGFSTFIINKSPWLHLPQKTAFLAVYVFILWRFFVCENKTYPAFLAHAAAGYLSYFMLNTGVHENHLFLVPILTSVLVWQDKTYLLPHLTWTLMANLNLVLFYGLGGRGSGFSRAWFTDITWVFALVAVLLYVVFVWDTLYQYRTPRRQRVEVASETPRPCPEPV